jgi:hypothetical protein
MIAVKAGIDPQVLLAQVKNTASWLWSDARGAPVTRVLDAADRGAYLRLLLVAHYATVGTFVPTDVDARIRHHEWVAIEDESSLRSACDVVDEIASWDPRLVSARVVETAHGALSGHDGEWLAVRAGALGRARALGVKDLAERLESAIDAELDREERILREGGDAQHSLSAATVVAHNLGDLSRVAEGNGLARYVRLGHPDGPHARAAFVAAGSMNKEMMALENHRFLALRKPRALRTSRALLLPIGPWFDAWGEAVARSLEERDAGEVVAALLELHLSSPEQQGCLRALAGIHRVAKGGLASFAHALPARVRKELPRGRVHDAINVAEAAFRARLEHRFRTALDRTRIIHSGGIRA